MCGITGILKFDPHATIDERRLIAMRDSLIHRGPDSAGIMNRGQIALAHRRLSIIDIGGGHQPMSNPSKDAWITYNGELYNFRELRQKLITAGCAFTTQSDTEVVLRAYEIYGAGCVHHLEGMFAFAIWDAKKRELFLARDRLGIKPLYYAITESELLFASEIKAILAGSNQSPSLNRAILPEYLASRYVAGNETFFEGVHKLLPGRTLSWSAAKGLTEHHYWQPPKVIEDTHFGYQDHVHAVRNALDEAVQSHLVSDVPIGLFLSGGLDSTALAGLMAPKVSGAIKTFSVGFKEASANELHYARLAARSVDAEHREILLSPDQFFAELPHLLWHEDEPIAFTSSIPLNVISRLARQHVKVVLTGEGADELFLGYGHRYRTTIWNTRLGGLYEGTLPGTLRLRIAQIIPDLPKRLRRYAERSFLALGCNPRSIFFDNFSVFRDGTRQQLLSDHSLEASRDIYKPHLENYLAAGSDTLACMSNADLQTYLVELLMKQDQMSMAASLESRVPFLDHRLVDMVAAIPGRHRMHGGRTKGLLRDAVKDIVPTAIMNRSKMGFPVPVGDWLRGPFSGMIEEFVLSERAQRRDHFNRDYLSRLAHEHHSGSANHGDQLWLLINLEMWQRIYIDGEPHEQMYSGIASRSVPNASSINSAEWVSV